MKNINLLLNKNKTLHTDVLENKLWLLAKEQIEYQNYIDAGGNARTARDKVIAELISKDTENWYDRDAEYQKLKIDVKISDDRLQIVKGLIANGKEEIAEKFLELPEDN